MSKNILQDQKVRDKITGDISVKDLQKAQFVKAGAGAGKTYSIKHRVLNLAKKLKIEPEKMVIITYTTKAANELLTRIREILETSGEREALEKLPYAKISTFHAFCYDLLREYPIEFGLDPDLELADEGTTQIMLENCFQRMAEEAEHISDDDFFISEKNLLREMNNELEEKQIENLKKTLLEFYKNRDLTPYKVDTSVLRHVSHIDTDLEAVIKEHYELAHELVKNLKAGNEDDKLYRHIKDQMWPEISTLTVEEYVDHIIQGGYVQKAGRLGRKTSYRNGGLVTLFKECTKRYYNLSDEKENVKNIINYNRAIELFDYFNHVVDDYKRFSGVIDFFDCLFLVRNALEDNKVLQDLVQQRFDVVIIDEFQDSDPMQADIAFMLAGENTEKLFFVGDPKQSIYSFARADISVYLEVMERVGKLNSGEILELSTNFRSSGGLLDFINTNFSEILSDIGYKNMHPCEDKKDSPFSAEMWTILPKIAGEDKCNSDPRHEREAFIVAKDIKDKIDSGEYSPGDFMILFRAGSHMAKYEKALKMLDIPVVNTKSKGFLNQSEIIELLNLLALCALPEDKYFRYAVSNSYLYKIDEDILEGVLRSNSSFISRFRTLTCNSGLIALAINTNKSDYINFIENLLAITQRELIAANYNLKLTLSKLFEKAFLDNSRGNDGVADEALYIETVEPNAVRLMTIHGSKGLESRVVYLCAHSGGNRFKANKYVDRETHTIIVPSPFISKDASEFLGLDNLTAEYQKAEEIKDGEDRRLLYVSATRAKERFVLLCKEDKNSAFIQPLMDNRHTFNEINYCFTDYQEEYESIEKFLPGKNKSINFSENSSKFTSLIEENSISKAVTSLIEDKTLFENVEGRKNGLEFGIFVHKIMEHICTMIFFQKNIDIDTSAIVDKLNSLSSTKFSRKYIDEIKDMTAAFLSTPLAAEIIEADNIQTELPFFSNKGFHGVIDLIIEKDDSVKLIDFKSDLVGSNFAEIEAHYKQQMDYYVDAVAEVFTDKTVAGDCIYLFKA